MKIIKYLISLLEFDFDIEKDNKVYSEEELKQFAERARLYSIIMPPSAFCYAVKAKKSKNPDIVRKAEKAEMVAFFICLPMQLAIIIVGIGIWIFSGTWLGLMPIAIAFGILVFRIIRKRKIDK
ncbi:hypothetical protein COX73_00850 [bacterium (Candidatus Gribaldobacteria) CG_4_10_14_0_2_um_filter_36_18]|uniref:Uncharacterized protein n=1 Tax=bacterium (Candidatus Gribaldobacteria) CG_4_10_14_0_2_um_filter_36_18 TaxID=2014264 RepID=A0A2M7VKQ1_9BACT|nr:MAG: hypothetical protein COX73_00850 [bacterium (Candidatus Gribaldobacteria) CG_4_10_14_0_2_um_filter_36_18]